MGSKTKRHGKHVSVVDLFAHAQRCFERRHFKEAYKDAKVCYRQEPSEQHRWLLERAWFARAEELSLAGLRLDSQGMIKELLDFGVTEPSVKQSLPKLLLALGLFDRGNARQVGPPVEVDSQLLASAADHAVLKPAEAAGSLAGIRQGAASIRTALDLLYAGDEAAAMVAMKDISRNSPFADWRFFVRGLAAYYRQDQEDLAANWDRLDPGRLAARIAASLRTLADPGAPGYDDPRVRNAMRVIESDVSSQPVLLGLADLKTCHTEERWKDLLRSLRRLRAPLSQFSPELADRVTSVLCYAFVRKGEPSLLSELMEAAPALPIDPRWNRAWALLWEHPDEFDPDSAEQCWLRYLEDLAELPCLTPPERVRAQAMVWARIGDLYAEECQGERMPFGGPNASVATMQARAVECFAKSIALAPDLAFGYERLGEAHLGWRQEKEAAEAYRRLLERFPDHIDAMRFLIQHHQRRDECLLMRDYALRALRLRPSNKELIAMVWAGHVGSARHYAIQGEFDQGRAEFAAAERLNAQACEPYVLSARKAVFEYKAGNAALGRQLMEQAKSQTEDPAAALLVLCIESVRYRLPYSVDGIAAEFERRWIASLKRKRLSQTAGRMAFAMASYLAAGVDYPGRSAHVSRVLAYLRGCTRVRWEDDHLLSACEFLRLVNEEQECNEAGPLLEKLLDRALKLFPKHPVFLCMAGLLEIDKGPIDCDRRYARQCFEQAAELAKQSGDPAHARFVEITEKQLAFLGAMAANTSPFGGPIPFLDDEDDDEDGACFDDEDEEAFRRYDRPPPGIPPGGMFAMFAKVCASMGLDPDEVMEDIARGGPFRFRAGDDGPPSTGKKESTRKKRR